MVPSFQNYDAAIVGAGPAGSSLACRLAIAGLRVLLVEQKKYPREKLCGEFISPECLSHFAELGIMPAINGAVGTKLNETVFYARSGKGVGVKSEWFGASDLMALGLSRAEMDHKLLERARHLGVDVREETNAFRLKTVGKNVIGLYLRNKQGHETEVQSIVTVDATGRSRSLSRHLDIGNFDKRPAKFVAFKTHLRNATPKPNTCEIYAYHGGYGGCNRVENDLFNLCFIASARDTRQLNRDPERVLREVVFTNKRAAEAMSEAEIVKPWLAVPIESFGRAELVPALGLLTVGDSAAFIDPFTGSGILLALESSKLAARAIMDHRLDFPMLAAKYKRLYSFAFDHRLRVCSLLRYAAFVPFWAESAISLLSISEVLRRRVARSTRFSSNPDF